MAECIAMAMACFHRKSTPTTTIWPVLVTGHPIDRLTGGGQPPATAKSTCIAQQAAAPAQTMAKVAPQTSSNVQGSFRPSRRASDLHEVFGFIDSPQRKAALDSMTNAALVINQQGDSRPLDSQS